MTAYSVLKSSRLPTTIPLSDTLIVLLVIKTFEVNTWLLTLLIIAITFKWCLWIFSFAYEKQVDPFETK